MADGGRPSYAVIAGAGSAGRTWHAVAREIDAVVMPIPDEPDVAAMAARVAAVVADLPRPRVLIAASAGAVVALDVARSVEVDALVFTAAGFGLEVSDRLLDWLAANPPDLHRKMAKICLADRDDQASIDTIVADYEALGQAVHLRQLRAVRGRRPEPLEDPPPTFVLWGVHDRAIPLEHHIELAAQCRGALVPVADAAHVPHFEQPQVVLEWIARAATLACARHDGSPARVDIDPAAQPVPPMVRRES
jgi:pimeloyl-ACP methyl ester carboxylesterase